MIPHACGCAAALPPRGSYSCLGAARRRSMLLRQRPRAWIANATGCPRVTEWSTLVDPEAPIPPAIQALTGITDAMVASAPTFSTIAGDVLSMLAGCVFVVAAARPQVLHLYAEPRRDLLHGTFRVAVEYHAAVVARCNRQAWRVVVVRRAPCGVSVTRPACAIEQREHTAERGHRVRHGATPSESVGIA